MIVYLAGGMRSEWRKQVRRAVLAPIYLDPTEHGLSEPKEYTAWDIEAIEASDLIFAYFETANPYGFNMAYEMGYAEALGKKVIFVNEKFADNDRPVSMLVVKSIVTKTLEGGIEALKAVVADE